MRNYTNKICGIRWEVAFGIPLFVLIALVWLFFGLLAARGETPSVPTPPATSPPAFPSSVVATTNAAGAIALSAALPAEFEWELTFEWVPEPGSSNVVVYPIKIQVPFAHDHGFVFVRARMVRLRSPLEVEVSK